MSAVFKISSAVSRTSSSWARTATFAYPTTRTTTPTTSYSTTSSTTVDKNILQNAKPYKDIPGPKGIYDLPQIGFLFHLKPFTNYTMLNADRLFDDLVKKYGPIFKMQTDKPTVMISDPEDFGHVFRNDGQYPIRPSFDLFKVYYKRTGFRPDIGCEQGAPWWRLKVPTHKAMMKPANIHWCLPEMNKIADDFVKMMTSGDFNDRGFDATFMAYTAESAGIPLFNTRLGFLDGDAPEETRKFLEATVTMFSMMQSTVLGASTMYKFYRSKDYMVYEEARNLIKFTVQKHVKVAYDKLMAKKSAGTFDEDEPNVLSSLLGDKSYTLDDVLVMMESVYIAAIDSSASTIQALFHNLATHPDKQEKLRTEIHDVLGFHKPLAIEDLEHMPYLKAVIRENYRYSYPLVIGTYRKLPVDIVVKGYTIPAMTQIFNLNGQACKNYFEDPDKFVPERWLREKHAPMSDKEQIRRWAVLPFGYGKRSCSGRKLFEQELYLILAKTLQKLHIGLQDESKNTEFEYGLFLKPVDPIKFKFTPLDPCTGGVPQSVLDDYAFDDSLKP